MTTPAGVPNLPLAALTLDNIADRLQDMTATAMHGRAADHMPSIFDLSTGGNILSDLTPFGIITRIWAEINSLIANADPADIQGPDDLPDLFFDFINELPGQFIAFIKRMILTAVEFLRAIPVLNDLIAPFLDALEDLVNDIPETLLDFLNPIEWAKRLLRFAAQFVRGIPVLGELIAPFIDAVEDMVNDIPETMLDLLNPITWMGWISGGFLSQFGLDFDWLTGLTGTNSGSPNFLTGILGLLGNPAGLLTGAPVLGEVESIPLLGGLLSGFIGGGLPFNVLNLFGTLPSGLLGTVPVGALTDETPNLLPQGMFPPGSVAPGDGWVGDAVKTATADSTGSVQRAADGKNHGLRSTPVTGVPGKTLDLSIKVWWQSYTGSGSPLQLGIVKYKNNIEVGRTTIASTSASGTSSSWTTLSGQYEWPTDNSVDSIKLRCIITSTATGGTIWFDDAKIEQPGEIDQAWVTDLIPQFEGLLDLFGLGSLFDLIGLNPFTIWANIIDGALNFFEPIWNKLFDVFGGVVGSAGKTLTGVLNIGKDFFDALAGVTGATFSQLTTRMTELLQLLQVLAGNIVTPITSLITDTVTRLQYIGTNGILSSIGIPTLSQSKISDLVADLTDRVTYAGGLDAFDDFRNRLSDAFGGLSSGQDNLDVNNAFEDFFEIVANAPATLTNLDTNTTRIYQTFDILRGAAVTPIDSIVNGIKTWYDTHF